LYSGIYLLTVSRARSHNAW